MRREPSWGGPLAVLPEVPPLAIPGTFVGAPRYRQPRITEGAVGAVDLVELVEHWTLLDDERELVAGKRGPARLGFALLLKFQTLHADSRIRVRVLDSG